MHPEILDVLIIGAGVSGIAMACTLKAQCPNKRFAILERRARLGGTWDLFRFPGVRSDSDMHSYAFGFRRWRSFQFLGGGDAIRDYLADTARSADIDQSIRYGVRIHEAHWSSTDQLWTVIASTDDGSRTCRYRCRFLVMGTGYYDQDGGHTPALAGLEQFAGPVIHPQHWPEQLDCASKRIVVVGSGATAITLVPALARSAAKVTMLQRSPTYLLTLPSKDTVSRLLSRMMPARWAFALARRMNVTLADLLYRAARRWPATIRRMLLAQVRAQLRGAADMRHFEPRYQPWDERLCIVSDGDLFTQIRAGRVDVVTDEIAGFAADRVRLRSGHEIEADMVVTATGLKLQALGGIKLSVDGKDYRPGEHMLYKGVLLEGLPNSAWIIGYINAAWTLRAEMAATYICRLLRHMDATCNAVAVPHDSEGCRGDESIMCALTAGYVRRARQEIPRQGSKAPWQVTHDQRIDRRQLIHAPIEDDALRFEGRRVTFENEPFETDTTSKARSLPKKMVPDTFFSGNGS